MRLDRTLAAAVLAIALIASLGSPAFAGGPKGPSTNVGVNAGCVTFIVCQSSTNGSGPCKATSVVRQCSRKS